MASPALARTQLPSAITGERRLIREKERERERDGGRGGRGRDADFISHRGDFPQSRLRRARLAQEATGSLARRRSNVAS